MVTRGNPIFTRSGVLTREDDPTFAEAIQAAQTRPGVVTLTQSGGPRDMSASDITQEENTGRIRFTSDGVNYLIRELREDDGAWLSQYKLLLPTEALVGLITEGRERG